MTSSAIPLRRPTRVPGISLTELSFGAAAIGNLYRATSEDEARGAVAAAWAAGVRYFDTAPHYGLGLSERRLGKALADYPRDQVVVSTKVGRLLVPNPGRQHQRDQEGFDVPATSVRIRDYSGDGVRRSLEESLIRLGLDQVDIVYVHDPDDAWKQALHEAVPALVALREEGVIRAIGVGMNQAEMLAAFTMQTDIDLVMLAGRYTLLEQDALDSVMGAALARGVKIVNAGVFNSGLLAHDVPLADATYDYKPAPPELIQRATRIAEVCRDYGVSLPAAAAQFSLLHPAVVSVTIGCRTAAQVRRNVDLFAEHVPRQLWEDLQDRALIRSDAPVSFPPQNRIGS